MHRQHFIYNLTPCVVQWESSDVMRTISCVCCVWCEVSLRSVSWAPAVTSGLSWIFSRWKKPPTGNAPKLHWEERARESHTWGLWTGSRASCAYKCVCSTLWISFHTSSLFICCQRTLFLLFIIRDTINKTFILSNNLNATAPIISDYIPAVKLSLAPSLGKFIMKH